LFSSFRDDIPYDDNSAYEYALAIEERLKRANEEFQQDQTPIELNHRQRVSFDVNVKAIDIILDLSEQDNSDLLNQSLRTSIQEQPIEILPSPRSDNNSTYEYILPLNDLQPKQGLSLLEKIKELQFHNYLIDEEQRWATTAHNDSISTNINCPDETSVAPSKSNENNLDNQDLSIDTSLSAASSKKTMIVAVNGRFDLQNEDDYTALTKKSMFIPVPPTEPKRKTNSAHRPTLVRPKSSTIEKKSSQLETTVKERPKRLAQLFSNILNISLFVFLLPFSASSSKSLEAYIQKFD